MIKASIPGYRHPKTELRASIGPTAPESQTRNVERRCIRKRRPDEGACLGVFDDPRNLGFTTNC